MGKKTIFFLSFLIISLTYSFLVKSQEAKKIINCSEMQILLLSEKEKLQILSVSRKQSLSDYSASIQNIVKDKKLGSKQQKEIQDFESESRSIINEIENLIFKIDRLPLLNCSESKEFYSEKVKSIYLDYSNLIKKEEKLIRAFEKDLYTILKELK